MHTLSFLPTRTLMASLGLVVFGSLTAAGPAAAQEKTVTIVLSEEPPDADVCNMNKSTIGRFVRHNVGETLTVIDRKTGELAPYLAKSWTRVDDKTWRFKLVENAKFHDGAPFNAEAVVKGLERTFHDPKITCINKAKAAIPSVVGKAVDEYTVDISLDKPAPILPVSMNIVAIASPNAPLDKMANIAIGTGPYKMVSRTSTEIVLERNEDYWGKKPEVQRARFIWRSESSVRAQMVAIGEADLTPDIAVQDATNPATDVSYLNSETTRLRFELDKAPQNDKRVREAMQYAIDRNALRGTVFSKDVVPATHMFEPGVPGYNADVKLRPYDPAKAKALIAAAKADGVPVDKEMTLICRANQWPGAQEAMEAITGYFRAVGLNVGLRCVENGQHTDMNTKPFDPNRGPILIQDSHDNANGDPAFTAITKYACEGANSTLCDKKLDDMIYRASALPIGPERVAAWKEAFGYLYADLVPDVTLFHMVGYARIGKRIDYKPTIDTGTSVALSSITFK